MPLLLYIIFKIDLIERLISLPNLLVLHEIEMKYSILSEF